MYYKSGQGLEGLGPVQTDATLFATSSQHFWMLHVASVCAPCCMLLHKVWNWSNFSANNSQRFFCSMIAKAKRNNVGSVCTVLPTLLGPCMLIMHGLQRLMGCILSTMHCRSQTLLGVVASVCTPLPTCTQQLLTSLDQQCWELLCPFACSLRNCSEMWQRRWPWGNQTQLPNVCHLVPFLLPTSLWMQSSLLAPHGEGQLCSSIFHLIVLTVACELLICISFAVFQMPCPTWCLVKWKADQALGIITPFIAQRMDKN